MPRSTSTAPRPATTRYALTANVNADSLAWDIEKRRGGLRAEWDFTVERQNGLIAARFGDAWAAELSSTTTTDPRACLGASYHQLYIPPTTGMRICISSTEHFGLVIVVTPPTQTADGLEMVIEFASIPK